MTLDMSSEDLGAPAYRKFNTEAWMPGLCCYGGYVVPDPNFVFDMPMHCLSSLRVWVVVVLKLDVSCN